MEIDPGFAQNVTITTVAGETPAQTADRLATAIRTALAAATPPMVANVVPTGNPPVVGQAIGSADVIVGNPLTQVVRLTVVTSNDNGHPVLVGRIATTAITDFVNADSHVGKIQSGRDQTTHRSDR